MSYRHNFLLMKMSFAWHGNFSNLAAIDLVTEKCHLLVNDCRYFDQNFTEMLPN